MLPPTKTKRHLFRFFSNLPGWRINRKIVVIESDDWGSIRMPSLQAFEKLENAGVNLTGGDTKRYNLNDTLATAEDLERLFEVISGIKDSTGNHAVFTPITIVANPDFQKIESSGFSEYYYEPFTETLRKYPGCHKSFDLWKEGIENKIFVPQMHGREHLNVIAWMKALQNRDMHTLLAFNEGLWGFGSSHKSMRNTSFQAAFLFEDSSELKYHKQVISEGLDLFENIFGYRAKYFVPPNGCFNNTLNGTLFENGIKFRSVSKIQFEPIGNGKIRKLLHWHGQKHKSGLRYITRNCLFEPSQPDRDWTDSCLKAIKMAFYCHKPAIISSHRVNYIGALRPSNRDNSLRQLRLLLRMMVKNWPDIEFMTTAQLGALMFGQREKV